MTNITRSEVPTELISYAFLKVANEQRQDYYDYFKPFIKQILYDYDLEFVTANNIQTRLEASFKIVLPVQVINTILRRLDRENVLEKDNRVYKIKKSAINVTTFNNTKQQLLIQHNAVINKFKEFAKVKYSTLLNNEQAEKAIMRLLDQKSMAIIKRGHMETAVKDETDFKSQKELILAAKFIEDAIENDSLTYNHIIEVVKGHMLMQAIYTDDLHFDSITMKFNNVQIFFDTTFILYALGYSGEALEKTCSELLKMLKEADAHLCVLGINVNEAMGILEKCKISIDNPSIDKHNTVMTLLKKGIKSSDIDEIIINFESILTEKLGLKVIHNVPYNNYNHVINHEALTKHLKDAIRYRSEKALENDVEVIAAIKRLQKGKKTVKLEECKALFVTTNYHLAKYSNEYFNAENQTKLITPVMYDGYLTNLMWLKNPQLSPDLPHNILIADCYAAVQPTEGFWKKCMFSLDTLALAGKISSERVLALKYSQGFNIALMDMFLGDEEVVAIGEVERIIEQLDHDVLKKQEEMVREERNRNEIERKKLEESLESERKKSKALAVENEKKNEESLIEKQENEKRLQRIAGKKAKKQRWIIQMVSTFIISILVVFFSQHLSQFENRTQYVLLFIFTGIPLIMTILGWTCKSWFDKLEESIKKRTYDRFKNS